MFGGVSPTAPTAGLAVMFSSSYGLLVAQHPCVGVRTIPWEINLACVNRTLLQFIVSIYKKETFAFHY